MIYCYGTLTPANVNNQRAALDSAFSPSVVKQLVTMFDVYNSVPAIIETSTQRLGLFQVTTLVITVAGKDSKKENQI